MIETFWSSRSEEELERALNTCWADSFLNLSWEELRSFFMDRLPPLSPDHRMGPSHLALLHCMIALVLRAQQCKDFLEVAMFVPPPQGPTANEVMHHARKHLEAAEDEGISDLFMVYSYALMMVYTSLDVDRTQKRSRFSAKHGNLWLARAIIHAQVRHSPRD